LAFPNETTAPSGAARAASAAHRNGALARRDADGRCVGKPSARQGCCIEDAAPLTQASARPALARQEERRERLRVSTKTPRPQERKARDRARPPETPAQHFTCSRSLPGWAGTTGPVRAADRAGRPPGQPGPDPSPTHFTAG